MAKPNLKKPSPDARELQGRYKTFLDTLTKPIVLQAIGKLEEVKKLIYALQVRMNYKDSWVWGASAEYLYREFIRGIGLENWEEALIYLAKSRPGRREERELAGKIWALKAEGRTVPKIVSMFQSEGKNYSEETIKSYLKTRRRKQTE
jgi:hypothetical protein